MHELSSLNTSQIIDYDNLNIVIRPRPPRRRQSGISLVPFRPYVKCLTSERQPFSFTNGKDQWITTGNKQTFFKQENARCIGSLMEDCDASDVIRWDIQGESTRLPMMCKLWIIVDGAVVERGKPRLVQDAAIQVSTFGRTYRSILESEQQYRRPTITKIDRRRRHSWQDVNEYHSVPYYQYTCAVRSGFEKGIQCNMDPERLISIQQYLPHVSEETVDEHHSIYLIKHAAQQTVHQQTIPQNRVQISIMTQTEHHLIDRPTSMDNDFTELFNLNNQTNENLLSSIANPNRDNDSTNNYWETRVNISNGKTYINRSVSTGDDYPKWWLQLSTSTILSSSITQQTEDQLKIIPKKQLDQSIQTLNEQDLYIDLEKLKPSPRTHKSSSSLTINNHYEIIDEIDDGNNAQRLFPYSNQHQRVDSHYDADSRLSDNQMETSSNHTYSNIRPTRSSSKQSDSDYHTLSVNTNQQTYSVIDQQNLLQQSFCSSIQTNPRTTPRKHFENSSNQILSTLFQRYEKTLHERQRATAVINDELLDINHLLKHYRDKLHKSSSNQSNHSLEVAQDSTILSQIKDRENLSVAHLTKDKYRQMANLTSEQMLYGYIPSPRIYLTDSTIITPRKRQPRFDYCDLYVTDLSTSSAWIRYNEQRIEELQKRIDLMLQIDDSEEAQFLLSPTYTLKSHIDDILNKRSKRLINYHHRILLPRRYNFRLPYRFNQPYTNSSRLLTRNLTRPKSSVSKSVRISTNHEIIPARKSTKSFSRPLVSILRRNHINSVVQSRRLVDPSHVWKNDSDGKVYILEQFSIPRYYRLYNDVSFREVYNFSRLLEPYLRRTQTNSKVYSSIVRDFALNRHLPTITSAA